MIRYASGNTMNNKGTASMERRIAKSGIFVSSSLFLGFDSKYKFLRTSRVGSRILQYEFRYEASLVE